MRRLLIATNNRGKVREYREILAGLPFDLVSLADAGIDADVAETGSTFAENAAIKARAYAQMSGLLALGDDSGLEVDALGGEPGVWSARYGGDGLDDRGRYELLLVKMAEVPAGARTARFRCVIAIAEPSGELSLADGKVEGTVAFAPKGDQGFGYDPVFLFPDRGLTMAELPSEEKNHISHRAQAGKEARRILETLYRVSE
ncbi:MAG: XTP/dITP diphosphatase [Chloroflexota bacterium]